MRWGYEDMVYGGVDECYMNTIHLPSSEAKTTWLLCHDSLPESKKA